jgi:hypothetical protein
MSSTDSRQTAIVDRTQEISAVGVGANYRKSNSSLWLTRKQHDDTDEHNEGDSELKQDPQHSGEHAPGRS